MKIEPPAVASSENRPQAVGHLLPAARDRRTLRVKKCPQDPFHGRHPARTDEFPQIKLGCITGRTRQGIRLLAEGRPGGVDDVFPPERRTMPQLGIPLENQWARWPGLTYQLPVQCWVGPHHSAVITGIARAGIHSLIDLAGGKQPRGRPAGLSPLLHRGRICAAAGKLPRALRGKSRSARLRLGQILPLKDVSAEMCDPNRRRASRLRRFSAVFASSVLSRDMRQFES